MKKGIILGIIFIVAFSLINFGVEKTMPNNPNKAIITIGFYILAGILIRNTQKTVFRDAVE